MNEKYYTPELEDFCIGYELEYKPANNSEFTKLIVDKYFQSSRWGYEELSYEEFVKEGRIRVSYLTKGQIEQEGWLVSAVDDFYNKTGNRLTYDELSNELCIIQTPKITIDEARDWPEGKGNYNLFRGKCKSINEFRTIMKLLSIK